MILMYDILHHHIELYVSHRDITASKEYNGNDETSTSTQTQSLRDNTIVAKLKLIKIEAAIPRALYDPLYPHRKDTVQDNQGQKKSSRCCLWESIDGGDGKCVMH